MAASPDELELHLRIQLRRLVVTVANSSRRRLNLWEWNNSWGWHSLTIHVSSGADEQVGVRHTSREWTKNGPDYFVLEPQESREVTIDLRDGWWETAATDPAGTARPGWRDRPVRLRARLQIPRTPESDLLGVVVGTVLSSWITSFPPHDWLILDSDHGPVGG